MDEDIRSSLDRLLGHAVAGKTPITTKTVLLAGAILENVEAPLSDWRSYLLSLEDFENKEAIERSRRLVADGADAMCGTTFDILRDAWELRLLMEISPTGPTGRQLYVELLDPYDWTNREQMLTAKVPPEPLTPPSSARHSLINLGSVLHGVGIGEEKLQHVLGSLTGGTYLPDAQAPTRSDAERRKKSP